jgi:hypothetical protein
LQADHLLCIEQIKDFTEGVLDPSRFVVTAEGSESEEEKEYLKVAANGNGWVMFADLVVRSVEGSECLYLEVGGCERDKIFLGYKGKRLLWVLDYYDPEQEFDVGSLDVIYFDKAGFATRSSLTALLKGFSFAD